MSKSLSTPGSHVWKSGDWVSPRRKQPPYNGVEIIAVPVYGSQGKLESMKVTISDFTKGKSGDSVSHVFEPPASGDKISLKSSGNFTIHGHLSLKLTASLSSSIVIFLDIYYGLPEQQRHAEGGVLAIPLVGSKNTDSKEEKEEISTKKTSTGKTITEKTANSPKSRRSKKMAKKSSTD